VHQHLQAKVQCQSRLAYARSRGQRGHLAQRQATAKETVDSRHSSFEKLALVLIHPLCDGIGQRRRGLDLLDIHYRVCLLGLAKNRAATLLPSVGHLPRAVVEVVSTEAHQPHPLHDDLGGFGNAPAASSQVAGHREHRLPAAGWHDEAVLDKPPRQVRHAVMLHRDALHRGLEGFPVVDSSAVAVPQPRERSLAVLPVDEAW